jgi:serine/threonine-protein kinase
VFRAFDPDRDRLVAVKHFRLDLPPELVHQLVDDFERLIAAAFNHPAVIAPVAAGIEGVTAYLAQDYVSAESLDITLRHGRASVADSLRAAAELASALDAAAAVHIEHGVLHPRDVLLSADEVRLTGLGIARAVERVGVPTQVRRPYTAPERTIGSDWDRRTDVFALAAMIHEMLWGRRVAEAGDEAAGALTEIDGGDLSRLRKVFGRALAKDPAKRFDTALEFAGALNEAFVRGVRLQPDRTFGVQPDRVGRQPADPTTVRLKADTTYETEPRLPLEPLAGSAPSLALFEPESRRFAVVDAVDTTPVDPAIDVMNANAAEMPPLLPPEVMESYRPSPDRVLTGERSRSTISPLAFALLIGAALGFAAGFGVGTWGRSPNSDEAATSEASAAPDTNDAREFTEAEIRLKPDTTAALKPGATAATPSNLEDRGVREDRGAPLLPSGQASADRRSVPVIGQSDRRTGAPKPAPAAPIVGSLLVRSTPLGARVLVDGREYGRTPLTVGNLSRGAHNVRVVRDGYEPDDRQVTVTSAQRTHSMTVRLSPQRVAPVKSVASAASRPAAPSAAPLTVESRPAGAAVFLDGRLVGTTPLVVPGVAAGEHALHLDRDGYQRWSSTIRIVTTEKNRVTASLDR